MAAGRRPGGRARGLLVHGTVTRPPLVTRSQLNLIVAGFFSYNTDPQGFKGHLRDFLIDCKARWLFDGGPLFFRCRHRRFFSQEAAGEDMTQLFLLERQSALEQATQEKMDRLRMIPGMMVASAVTGDFDDAQEAEAGAA